MRPKAFSTACTCSLSGGRRASAHARLLRPDTDESFEQRHETVGGEWEGRLLIEENTFPSRTFPTQSGVCTSLSRVGECADEITERTRPLLSEVGRLDFLGHVPQQ